jgi:hypothetical protein
MWVNTNRGVEVVLIRSIALRCSFRLSESKRQIGTPHKSEPTCDARVFAFDFLPEPQRKRCLRVRYKLVGIRFAAVPGLDIRFRGGTGDIRTRGGGRWQH